MNRARCHVCGCAYADHYGADCPRPDSTDSEVTRLRLSLSRLEAKHRRYAEETNRLLTEQHAEIQRLRSTERTDVTPPLTLVVYADAALLSLLTLGLAVLDLRRYRTATHTRGDGARGAQSLIGAPADPAVELFTLTATSANVHAPLVDRSA